MREGTAFITTIAYVGVGIAALSLVVGVAGAQQQAENAKDVADYNKAVEDLKAKDALQIGADEAAAARARARKIISGQIEGGAMSGVATDYGTPLGLLVETAGVGEHEALTIVNNAQRQAWGHQAQGRLDVIEGQNAKRAGTLNMAGSALSGATGVLNAGYKSGLWTTPAKKP